MVLLLNILKMQLRLSGQYCDVVAIRCFADLKIKIRHRRKDFNAFSKYLNKPLISMEAATRHPLQSLQTPLP